MLNIIAFTHISFFDNNLCCSYPYVCLSVAVYDNQCAQYVHKTLRSVHEAGYIYNITYIISGTVHNG